MQFDQMGNTCVVGLQWGDEGKGKVVDILLDHFDVVVRYSGGANAGHTIVIGDEKFALHQLPSGVIRDGIICLIACGSVVDPAILLGEIEGLRARGIAVGELLRISNRAQIVFPYHRKQDVLAEAAALPGGKLGTTSRGIGPCYADKVSRRWGVRVCELFDETRLRSRLARIISHKNAYLNVLYDMRTPFDSEAITEEYLEFARRLRPHVADTTIELRDLLKAGKRVLFEGAQGSLLDIDHGTYPFVTSASAGIGGVASGAGVSPMAINSIVGVIKAYSTRVGEGPMPTELSGDLANTIREKGQEFGTTTARPRRIGWFDAVSVGYVSAFTSPTHLAISHLDTLTGIDELRICVGYKIDGKTVNTLPAETYKLDDAECVYETLPGWQMDISLCRTVDDLPREARDYLRRISDALGAPISMIGTGPARDQNIFVEGKV
jgi:adenylosuccinate synthase